jgi:hypothetical protein
VEITDSAVLVAEEMSDISWEDLIDMFASPTGRLLYN